MDKQELLKRKEQLITKMAQLDAKQMSIKIFINSVYGLTIKSH